jgi:hypothetical protein
MKRGQATFSGEVCLDGKRVGGRGLVGGGGRVPGESSQSPFRPVACSHPDGCLSGGEHVLSRAAGAALREHMLTRLRLPATPCRACPACGGP